jgi:hypothetical protein
MVNLSLPLGSGGGSGRFIASLFRTPDPKFARCDNAEPTGTETVLLHQRYGDIRADADRLTGITRQDEPARFLVLQWMWRRCGDLRGWAVCWHWFDSVRLVKTGRRRVASFAPPAVAIRHTDEPSGNRCGVGAGVLPSRASAALLVPQRPIILSAIAGRFILFSCG